MKGDGEMARKKTVKTGGNDWHHEFLPRYTLSDRMVSLVAEITEVATHLEMRVNSWSLC